MNKSYLPAGSQCSGYRSPFTCGCGKPGYAHVTLVETKEERVARGHPVGRDVPYAAMGGLTGFSSLADGYLRLDPSGIGNTHENSKHNRLHHILRRHYIQYTNKQDVNISIVHTSRVNITF